MGTIFHKEEMGVLHSPPESVQEQIVESALEAQLAKDFPLLAQEAESRGMTIIELIRTSLAPRGQLS